MTARPRRLRWAARAAAFALVLLASSAVSAGPPTERLRDFFAGVNAVLADPAIREQPLERLEKIRRLVNNLCDFRETAAAALGRAWQARTPAEQDEFAGLFADLLERAYVGRLAGKARVNGGIQIAYLGESVAGDEATVQTAMGARAGGETLLDLRMVNRHGRWLVRDLVMDGVSTVENYQAQFSRIIRAGSYQDLVAQMRAKLDEESVFVAQTSMLRRLALEPPRAEPARGAKFDDGVTERDPHPSLVRAAETKAEPVTARAPAAPPARNPGPAAAAPAVGIAMAPVRETPKPTVPARPMSEATTPVASVSGVQAPPARPGAPAASYWIQVGAFKSAATAGRLASRLQGEILVSPGPLAVGNGDADTLLLRVRVGPFAERAQAIAKLRELQALGYQPFIAATQE